MATRELKPGLTLNLPNLAAATVTDHFGIKGSSTNGQWPRALETQIIPGAGNTAFSVTLEHTLDPNQTTGWQVVATITTAAPVQVNICGGWYRWTIGTATGGPVTVLAAVS